MATCRNIGIVRTLAAGLLVAALAACGKLDEAVTRAQDAIVKALLNQGIYERGNLPTDPTPTPEQIKGRYDIIGGAYRHIVNGEDRANRGGAEFEIARGDSISFMFDARIFTGGNFDGMQTFYTNIEARIKTITGNNAEFSGWSTDPLKIRVGDDPGILKSLQEALIREGNPCRAGDGDPTNDNIPGGVASDQVRIYLTPDIAFGDRTVYNVPAGSTIVFEVTDIKIIR